MAAAGSSSGGSSSRSFKPKASEIAHQTKKSIIPHIQKTYADRWKMYSYYYQQPMAQISLPPLEYAPQATPIAVFVGDPVNYALHWMATENPSTRVALICAANEKKAGGDWVTGVVGYEERLCRRSTLSATLATPGPGSPTPNAFPMSSVGGIFSENVVVFRNEDDRSEPLSEDLWRDLPVCSMPPVRWPKVNMNQGWLQYSFDNERSLMREKIRGALAICLTNGIANVVVGDFGLGNNYRNPPYETAVLWNDVINNDPDIKGRIHNVAFIFEDAAQSTHRFILDDLVKRYSKRNGQVPQMVTDALKEEPVSDYSIFAQYFGQRLAKTLHFYKLLLSLSQDWKDLARETRCSECCSSAGQFRTIGVGPGCLVARRLDCASGRSKSKEIPLLVGPALSTERPFSLEDGGGISGKRSPPTPAGSPSRLHPHPHKAHYQTFYPTC